MKYWLKMIGTWNNPVNAWIAPHVEFSGAHGVPQIRKGDMMVLYATRHRRLFAIAEATSDAYNNSKIPGRWGKYSVDVVYHSNRNVANGPHGDDFDPPFRSYGGGYHELTPLRHQLAVTALSKKS